MKMYVKCPDKWDPMKLSPYTQAHSDLGASTAHVKCHTEHEHTNDEVNNNMMILIIVFAIWISLLLCSLSAIISKK